LTPAVVFLVLRFLLAVSLYLFLGYLLFLLWRGLRQSSDRLPAAPPAHLRALDDGIAVQRYPLADANTIGRAADNSVSLQHPSVSTYHARLTYRSAHWSLEDLGSRNGTLVNGLLVREPVAVTYGDELVFGKVAFCLEPGSAPTDEYRGGEGRGDRAAESGSGQDTTGEETHG
jgi:pSer/pThr/pTyr-binding forkhead associated (FHA) protein